MVHRTELQGGMFFTCELGYEYTQMQSTVYTIFFCWIFYTIKCSNIQFNMILKR